jgi:hypothetical protein
VAILHGGHHLNQTGRLERPQEPARVTRVEAEPGAQRPHLAALLADLPEHARLAERAAAGQVVLVERPDPLRDRAIEPPDLVDLGRAHSLILVRDRPA